MKKFSVFSVEVRGCARKINFGPTLLAAVGNALILMPRIPARGGRPKLWTAGGPANIIYISMHQPCLLV